MNQRAEVTWSLLSAANPGWDTSLSQRLSEQGEQTCNEGALLQAPHLLSLLLPLPPPLLLPGQELWMALCWLQMFCRTTHTPKDRG